jgi:alcohol-forming fatty acyl-CoA reductase
VTSDGAQRVRDRLAGKSILLTGASGFLGKAVLASLLRHGDGIERLVVVLRAPSDDAARRRLLDEVLVAEPFADLGPAAEVRRRVDEGRIRAVAADLGSDDPSEPPDAEGGPWAGIDIVIHCAATVSFEEPLDDALALNSFGPARLLERLLRAGSAPHFVHVSTAYVADRRSGEVSEDGLPHHALGALDPDLILADAREWRADAERESRADPRASRFAKAAAKDAARREGLDAEERAEDLRRRWVLDRLSRQGRRRALVEGWPDTYALSKALGERLLRGRSTRTTIVRPTIIESALRKPYPGWLEGIKVADPLILAYAAHGLTHLPGRAANRIDIVPVDHVAHACVVAAAHPPEGKLRTLAIASSARNPLAIGELAVHIREYFRREPLPGRNGSPIEIGELEFVDRRVALRRTIRRERLAAGLARLAISSPVPIPQERLLRSNRALAERVTRMVRIYGAYTELDCVFDDANACELARSLPEADRADLPFDTAAIDWEDYLQRVHLPQVRKLATGE